ncbi:MAG: hypothetical protein Aureis2KO_01840 [Aureisphaera sp.]
MTSVDCSKVKDGTYIIPLDNFEGMEGEFYRIERTGRYQSEILSMDNSVVRYSIKWLDDCTYLLFDEVTLSGENPNEIRKTDTLTVEITNVTSRFYKAVISTNYSDGISETKIFFDK